LHNRLNGETITPKTSHQVSRGLFRQIAAKPRSQGAAEPQAFREREYAL
jgi:hypothetical protein